MRALAILRRYSPPFLVGALTGAVITIGLGPAATLTFVGGAVYGLLTWLAVQP